MKPLGRREVLICGGAMAVPAISLAAPPASVRRHPGFQAWRQMAWPKTAPLGLPVLLPDGGQASLGQWLGEGPVALILWASWCAPCISEKPAQAFLSRRLSTVRSTARLKLLQAFDDLPTPAAIEGLARHGARGLDIARASPPLERALVDFFGASVNDPRRTAMPSELLLAPDRTELGRGKGSMIGPSGQSYWGDVQTFQFFVELGRVYA